MVKRIANSRGSIYLVCIGVAALILLLFLFVLDVQRLYAERDTAEYELERAAVSALTAALDGLELSDHNVVITAQAFEDEFRTLALALTDKYNWSVRNIQATIQTTRPPSVEATCELTLHFEFLRFLFPAEVSIPITVYAKHGRLDE